jgi:glucosylceramidase
MSSNSTNRRKFLKTSALGLLATATAAGSSRPETIATQNQPASSMPAPSSTLPVAAAEITPWVTNEKLRFARMDPIHWQPASTAPPEKSVVLDEAKTFQDVLGFGAAFTEASCFTFSRLTASAREQLFHELFHPSEMGLNVSRTCIGSSDYSLKAYTYDDGKPDPELKRFSIKHDQKYILPILREARQANPDLFLFSSPWSPPGWMKSGGSILGGSMRRHYFPAYAQYFIKFLRGYSEEGVNIQAVTVQNEVDTDQDWRMPACIWPQEYEIDFVAKFLGPALAEHDLKTKIWILDHNYNLWGRAVAELDNPVLRKYCDSVAWHGYVGKPEMMTRVHDADPDVQMYWTEGGSDYNKPDYLTDWSKWGRTFTGILRNWCRSITGWNFALDEHGRPNIGPFSCGGLVTIHSQTREITRSGQYWTFAHFARTIRRGARRIDSTSAIADLHHVAFINPDGSRVLVVTNSGPARTVTVQLAALQAEMVLDSDSVITWMWPGPAGN